MWSKSLKRSLEAVGLILILLVITGKFEASFATEVMSYIVIKNINDPFKKWDSLRMRLDFSFQGGSFTKSYIISSSEIPTNISIEIPYYPGLKFEIFVESYWRTTEYYRLSNLEKFYFPLPNKILILDLAYEIYSNRVYQIASEIRNGIQELMDKGFSPFLWVSEIDSLLKQGIMSACSGDYEVAMLFYRKITLLRDELNEERRKIFFLVPLSIIVLYFNIMFLSLFIKCFIEGKRGWIISFLTYLAFSFIFIIFQPDFRLIISHLMSDNFMINTTLFMIILSLSFVISTLLVNVLKDMEGFRKLSSIMKLAILNIRNKSLRYAILIFATSLTIASVTFVITLGTVYVRTELKSFVNHNLTALIINAGAKGIRWEDFSWLSSLPNVSITSPLSFDEIVPSLPENELILLREKGYFFAVNLRCQNLTAPIALRLFLEMDAFSSVYNLSHILLYGRFPRSFNEALISLQKAQELGVWLNDSIGYYQYVAHEGYKMLGSYFIVGLFDDEKLEGAREPCGEKILNLDLYNKYKTMHGNYGYKDVMISLWNEDVGLKRLTLLFKDCVDFEHLNKVIENLALTRIYDTYTVFMVHKGVATRIQYYKAPYFHSLPSIVIFLSPLILLIFSITYENIHGKASDYKILAVLGLNPTELKRLIILEIAFIESLAAFNGYVIGSVLLPIFLEGYAKAGPSYSTLATAIAFLVSLAGAYFPAKRIYSFITPSSLYKSRIADGVTKEIVYNQLPLRIKVEELSYFENFLCNKVAQRIMFKKPYIVVKLSGVKFEENYREYIYQVNYNTIPFEMSIRLWRECCNYRVRAELKKVSFVGKEYYEAILYVLRETILSYRIERIS